MHFDRVATNHDLRWLKLRVLNSGFLKFYLSNGLRLMHCQNRSALRELPLYLMFIIIGKVKELICKSGFSRVIELFRRCRAVTAARALLRVDLVELVFKPFTFLVLKVQDLV